MRVYWDRFTGLIFALIVLLVWAPAAMAGPYEDALDHFVADSFDETIEGIDGVAASGNPLAEKVIGALQDGRLFFSVSENKVYFREDTGNQLFAAETGSPAAGGEPADLAPVRLNNRLRRVIEAAF